MTGTPHFTSLLQGGPDLELESRPGTSCNDSLSTSSSLDSSLARESDSQHTYAKIVPCYHLLSAYVGDCGGLTSAARPSQFLAQLPPAGRGQNWRDKSKKTS